MSTKSIWRQEIYLELSKMILNGRILDIGGSSKAGYLSLIQGTHSIDINNIDESYGNTVSFDLEKPWPVEKETYDGILAINILEHLFDYKHTLLESHRVLKRGGKMVIAVPFLIAYHPCPHDYWRFTEETLKRILRDAGFTDITVIPLGSGIMGATTNLKHNMLQKIPIVCRIAQGTSKILDHFFSFFKKGKIFSAKYYPLGYVVTAEK
jgi:hypothetical protein